MIRLPDYCRNFLLKEEEFGMGFQIGSIVTMNGDKIRGVILNASVLCPISEYEKMGDLIGAFEYAIKNSSSLSLKDLLLEKRSLTKIRKITQTRNFSLERYIEKADSYGGAAEDAEISYTDNYDVFKRFSAYEKDFRITEKKGLHPGTFGTTEEDAKNITTGMDAIARYALKNKMSANNVFTINPPRNTKLKQGIVKPAYDELGGGVEVIFVNGSPDNTVTGPVKILEK